MAARARRAPLVDTLKAMDAYVTRKLTVGVNASDAKKNLNDATIRRPRAQNFVTSRDDVIARHNRWPKGAVDHGGRAKLG